MIEIRRAKGKQPYYFIIHARNGKILVTSECYKTKAMAKKGIKALGSGIRFFSGASYRVLDPIDPAWIKDLTEKKK